MLVTSIAGRVLGRCRADLSREDLVVEALSPQQGYAIGVRREGDGAHLPGSPYVLKPAIRIVREP